MNPALTSTNLSSLSLNHFKLMGFVYSVILCALYSKNSLLSCHGLKVLEFEAEFGSASVYPCMGFVLFTF